MNPDVYEQRLGHLADAITNLEGTMIDPREFGRLEGAVKSLTDKVQDLTTDVETLSRQVGKLADVMTEARGGWRAVAWVAGIASTIGAGIAWLAQNFQIKP